MDGDEHPEIDLPDRRRLRRSFVVALIPLVAAVAACGGGGADPLADPRIADDGPSAVVDPNTGEAFEVPEDFELAFGDGSDEAADDDSGGDDADDRDDATDAPPPVDDAPAPPAHPLEEVVIDETPSVEGEGSLDESGALACAQVEFALDAVIAGDAEALSDHLARAAALAEASSIGSLASRADTLTGLDDPAAVEAAVIDFLTACTESGYEL